MDNFEAEVSYIDEGGLKQGRIGLRVGEKILLIMIG